MKIDAMVEWTAEERAAKEREWRQSLFTLTLQKATGQLDNPMRLREIRKDIARLKTLDHMDAARAAAQKLHAEHEAAARPAVPEPEVTPAAPEAAPPAEETAAAVAAAAERAATSEEADSSEGKKAMAAPKRKGKAATKEKAASAKTSEKKTGVAAKGLSPSKKKTISPPGKAGSQRAPASKKKSK